MAARSVSWPLWARAGKPSGTFWNFPGPRGSLTAEPCPRLPHISVPLGAGGQGGVGWFGSGHLQPGNQPTRRTLGGPSAGAAAPQTGKREKGRFSGVMDTPTNPPGRKPDAQVPVGMRRGLGAYAPEKEALSLSLFIGENLHPPAHTCRTPPPPGRPPGWPAWPRPHLVSGYRPGNIWDLGQKHPRDADCLGGLGQHRQRPPGSHRPQNLSHAHDRALQEGEASRAFLAPCATGSRLNLHRVTTHMLALGPGGRGVRERGGGPGAARGRCP